MKFINKIITAFAFGGLLLTSATANDSFIPSNNTHLAVEYTLNKKVGIEFDKEFFKFTKADLEKIGFFINDAHHNVNTVYEKRIGKTSLDQLAFSTLINDDVARPLFNKDPRIAGFTPFNLVIYRKKDDMKTVITHITPEAVIDILQITDKDVKNQYIKMFKPLDKTIENKFDVKKSYTTIQGYAKHGMMNFEIPFKDQEDIDDFFDQFQEKFEAAFESKGYIIAGFYNMKYSLNTEADVLLDYDEYIVWSLCHIPFSYTIFDGTNPLPQAAIFAPCSMYAYIKHGEKKIVIGMPTLGAWAAALGITDKEKLKKINQLDTEIPATIRELGGIDTSSNNPLLR